LLVLRLQAEDTQAVGRLVREESVDLGLVYAPVAEPGIAAETLFRTALICLMPRNHPLASEPAISAHMLQGHRVIMLTSLTPPGLLLREALARGRSFIENPLETNTSFTAASLVREGLGVALTDPSILFSAAGEGLHALPFVPLIEMKLAVVYSRQWPVPMVGLRFVAILKAVLAETADGLRQRGLLGELI
jgi:DNA-binding transcriptional LysR family regulator